jgi:hypothetical protein
MTDFSLVPKAVFDSSIDRATFPYVNALGKYRIGDLGPAVSDLSIRAGPSIAEALIVAPRVTFKVFGENTALALLVSVFGTAGVEQLLRHDSVEFVIWNFRIMRQTDYAPVGYSRKQMDHYRRQNALPIITTRPRPHEYNFYEDAEASALAGLRLVPDLAKKSIARLARLAAEKTIIPEFPGTSDLAYWLVIDALARGEVFLDNVRLQPETITWTLRRVDYIYRLMTYVEEAYFLLRHELDVFENPGTWCALLDVMRQLHSSHEVLHTAEEILRVERIPSIRSLVRTGQLSARGVLRLREESATRAFREWLWTRPDPADAASVLAEYARVLKSAQVEKPMFRAARVLSLSALASSLATATGADFVGSVAVATGVGLIDELVRRVLKGRSPRRFSSVLRDREILARIGAQTSQE